MSAVRFPHEPTMDLFVPDIVRQSQFLSERASPSRFSGEYRLALAILEDAIQIYCMEGAGRRSLQLRREAGRWFNSDDRSWCFSFERICGSRKQSAWYNGWKTASAGACASRGDA